METLKIIPPLSADFPFSEAQRYSLLFLSFAQGKIE